MNSISAFNGWELDLIGKGVEWNGWITRMRSYMDYAAAMDPDTILVFLDAFDVLCLRDSDGFLDMFIQKGKKYIIGYEKVCAPQTCKKPLLWQQAHGVNHLYPNGGCVIGRARDIHYLWKWCIDRGLTGDDQIALGHFMDHHIDDVGLDIHNEFVYNDLGAITARIRVQDGILSIDDLEKIPFFIHYPALMLTRSIPLFSNHARPPHNYRVVAGSVLKDDAIFESFPTKKRIYNILRLVMIVVALLIVISLVLFIHHLYTSLKRCHQESGKRKKR
jgi:hypothetical protein